MDLFLLKAIGFLILVIVGIPGNIFILLQFTYLRILERKLLPANIILMMLALVNFLVILSRVIPQYLNAIGLQNLQSDTDCKFTGITFRVSRAMSICLTSFLSCHQCILIAPNTGLWSYLKVKVNQNVLLIIGVLWVMNISIYPYSVLYANARRNRTTSTYTLRLVYCDVDFLNYTAYIVNGALYALRDFLFVGLMTMASFYIVYVLVQHERSIRGIRSSIKVQKKSVEYKASRAVILLVVLYALLYGMDNSTWIYTLTLSNVSPDINDIRVFLASSYSSLSPIVIIATNPKLQQFFKNFYRKRSLPGISSYSSNSKVHINTIST